MPFLFLHWFANRLLSKPQFDCQRLSRFSYFSSEIGPTDLLIHCVSVGEVTVAASLIKTCLARNPKLKVCVTTTTPTGAKHLKSLLGERVQHLYLPIDLGWMMRRLLKGLQPKHVLVIEVELWPNMLRECHKLKIPVTLVNGRMTDKSARSYAKFPAIVEPMLQSLQHVCAQSERDFKNYKSLGVCKDRLTMTGNIKFDMSTTQSTVSDELIAKLGIQQRPLIIAGSTHEPEESILLEAFGLILARFSDAILMIVPRHPQRFEKVYELCQQSSIGALRSSESRQMTNQEHIVLIDQMGILSDLYRHASIAFVGGSIASRGGHNALEPAAVGVPVIMGSSVFNNPLICQTLAAEGNLVRVATSEQIAQRCITWLTDEPSRRLAGNAGKAVVTQNRGAIVNTLAIITKTQPSLNL
ncbi:3-deoxy-D-manno-octulosonic acid transferase [Aliiglaciecola sp. LCG003]|uniref:3-deoxy-D-manno-octulosonic acid transferase n=1 Tax=Aliiglaciecola sp. LCG003 TaxID=3053655 RepID=UPI0025727EF1|nr:3-deoxy-D-manno-octulosonic acid transferase [Aliiglaciecola sp. LCG003]WJG09516.1 3-deoxy-D-manno-octulosonic acid transferase [Aliiglaciecola sp. LCG003]